MSGLSNTKRTVSSTLNGWIVEKDIQRMHSEALHFAKWTASLVMPVFIILESAGQYIPLDKTYSFFPVTLLFNINLLSSLLGELLFCNLFYTALIKSFKLMVPYIIIHIK